MKFTFYVDHHPCAEVDVVGNEVVDVKPLECSEEFNSWFHWVELDKPSLVKRFLITRLYFEKGKTLEEGISINRGYNGDDGFWERLEDDSFPATWAGISEFVGNYIPL